MQLHQLKPLKSFIFRQENGHALSARFCGNESLESALRTTLEKTKNHNFEEICRHVNNVFHDFANHPLEVAVAKYGRVC